jgi:hypothetical protein
MKILTGGLESSNKDSQSRNDRLERTLHRHANRAYPPPESDEVLSL